MEDREKIDKTEKIYRRDRGDFILGGGCVSGVEGPHVKRGAKQGGGPGGARAVFLQSSLWW